jgi:arylsulfatase A-like enzyme
VRIVAPASDFSRLPQGAQGRTVKYLMRHCGWHEARLLIPAVMLATTLLAAVQSGCHAARPNVVLITVDTLRADHLHCYGFPSETSPSIDALAARSIVFERAIAASGCTGPSHASIMTSKYPRHHSMGYSNGQRRLISAQTLARLFREAGYATAAFVSNDVLARRSGFDQGFDVYNDALPQAEPNRPSVHERIAEQTTQAALAWLRTVGSRTFFLWVHYQDPHGPYTPPPPYRDKFHFPSEGQPELNVLSDESGFGGIPHYQAIDGLRRAAEYEGRYAGEIAYTDHWIGELLAGAQARSGRGQLVILLTADHGESLGEDNYFFAHGHSTAPDLSHVPFIFHLPGRAAERRRELVSHVDVMPTLLEAAGLPVPQDVDGIVLTRFLREAASIPERTVFCDIGYELSAYRDDEFLRALFVARKTWEVAMRYQSGQAGPVDPADLKDQQTFRWNGGGTWSKVEIDRRLEDDLLAYVSTPATPLGAAVSLMAPDVRTFAALAQAAAEGAN